MKTQSDYIKYIILSILLCTIPVVLHKGSYFLQLIIIIPLIFLFTYCAIIDYKFKLIPNKSIIIGLGLGLVSLVLYFVLDNKWFYESPTSSIIGFVMLPSIMLVYSLIMERITKNEAMGMGDIKAFAVIGFTLGFEKQLITFLIAGVMFMIFTVAIGIKNKTLKIALPMGPHILVGLIITLIFSGT